MLRMKEQYRKRYLKSKVKDCFLFLDLAYPFPEVNKRLKLDCDSLRHYLETVLGQTYHALQEHLSDFKILKFIHWKDSLNEKITKSYLYEGIYPSVLILAYAFLLLVYSFVFLPSVDSMMQDLSVSNGLLKSLSAQLYLHWFLIVLFLLLIAMIFYFLRNNDLRVLLYLKLHQTRFYQPVKLWWTHQFALYYKTFYEEGLDTKTILNLIRELPSSLAASWLAYHVDLSFLEGKQWQLDYLDPFFVLRLEVCHDYQEILEALNQFLLMSEMELDRYFNLFIKTMKGGVSLCLIAMITLYYQTLYLPLSILQTL